MFRPPTAAESAASADALEGFRRRSPESQVRLGRGDKILVKTPPGGIPARVGTTIFSAICTKIVETSTAEEKTLLETDEEIEVFNLETTAVSALIYVQTGLTGHGTRCVELSVPTPCDFIRFIINSVHQDVAPYFAVVDILSRTCGCSVVEEETEAGTGTGETIIVYDMAGCNFDEPAVDLIDRVGYAKYMIDELYEDFEASTGTGVGTGTGGGECRWEVVNLCCPSDCDPATGTG
ncbi:hypothetical protein LCGC14_0727930 [marine sediment metagenome]|uniref:Uncharacterized protein n=1 Tax=marine sediment metagenome TaxID=412755 RepID=A0A0F9SVQ0_9ZZZZ